MLTVADLMGNPVSVSLARVEHHIFLNTRDDTILAQVRHNIGRGLPELEQVPARRFGRRAASLCGSGPSLMQNLHRLRGKVMAINAAIPALHKAGVHIDYAMIWDASPEMVRYASDLPGTRWTIASRVNPAVIDALLDLRQDIVLWHAAPGDEEMREALMNRCCVFGGGYGATRGPFLLGAMGYRDLHIFGADASFATETHVGGSLRNEEEAAVLFEGKAYRTTMWMKHQAEQWVTFVVPELVTEGMRFAVYGEGLLPHAHASWERQVLATWPRHRRLAWRYSPWW
jgi:hypothetical protein